MTFAAVTDRMILHSHYFSCAIILSSQTASLHARVCSCGRCCPSRLRSTAMTDESLNAAVDASGLQSDVLDVTPSASSSRLSYWYDPAASTFIHYLLVVLLRLNYTCMHTIWVGLCSQSPLIATFISAGLPTHLAPSSCTRGSTFTDHCVCLQIIFA